MVDFYKKTERVSSEDITKAKEIALEAYKSINPLDLNPVFFGVDAIPNNDVIRIQFRHNKIDYLFEYKVSGFRAGSLWHEINS